MFDTNVVVLALIFGRCLRWLRRAWVTGTVIPIVCRETAAELVRVLTYPKFLLDSDERETLLGDYLPFAEVAHLPDELPDLPLACRDRDDDLVVLAAAYRVVSAATLQRRLDEMRDRFRPCSNRHDQQCQG